MNVATGEVVWYVTGRFYAQESGSGVTTLQDVGYFLYLRGIAGPLFNGNAGAEAAYFTFSSAPFGTEKIANGKLAISVDEKGPFGLFVHERPGASFDDPSSFSAGRRIATFERTSVVATTEIDGLGSGVALLSNVFTARLVSSTPFEFGGHQYDLAEIIGRGITQWGTAATEPMKPPPEYTAVVPFVGSAVRIGD
ncbi:MAG: hypothetical protein M3P06_02265 [Acidobacteriota bacterium]|nr:hypothetical protein [Acidobacteriota bacterium]